MTTEAIEVRGARVNNLKNISCSIPVGKLTVVTGVSGSGKSSLAFDTIYAEGQRRYVESLSAYARQFLERMDKPDVDEVRGIAPAIAIRQKNSTRNPRSTVGTQTEIYDYLRLLFARAGTTVCRVCARAVKKDAPESAADEVLATLPAGTRFYVLFPAAPEGSRGVGEWGSKGVEEKRSAPSGSFVPPLPHSPTPHLMSLMQQGFTRLFHNGQTIELRTPDDYARPDFTDVYVLVDRLAASAEIRQRLVDSLEICFRDGDGAAVIETASAQPQKAVFSSLIPHPSSLSEPQRFVFSERFLCKYDGTAYPEPEPRLFSFNNPYGACPTCQGFGNTVGLDLDLVIPNPALSLAQGAIEPLTREAHEWARQELREFCRARRISWVTSYNQLTKEQQRLIVEGQDDWRGVRGFFDYLDKQKFKVHLRVFVAKYRGYTRCHDCQGERLRQEARDVKIDGWSLPEICALSIKDAAELFTQIELTPERAAIAERILHEIRKRLKFLVDVGLDYLTLDRLAATLSGGEAQRIQLATNLGSSLVGALYVLDEPSIGLHPRDGDRLIKILHGLRDLGNTVLVVEHDADMMRAADHILDIGPAAGELGGHVIYEGNFQALLKDANSLTARYLRGEVEIKRPQQRRARGPRKLWLRGASEHNLQHLDVEIPLEMLVCVTGVSGSGKSTLIHDCLYAGLKKQRGEWQGPVGAFTELLGGDLVDDVMLVDQSPIGRTPRSNPVTYIKVYDAVREVFAHTREAQAHGYDAAYFSFNVPGGRCDTCEGSGTVTVEMQFLADVELVCEDCRGTRFKPQILDIKYRGKNIHDILNMTIREALLFFKDTPRISNKMRVLEDVGLGYLQLGQSATTLSGGEAQRVKLAAHLAKRTGAKTLYIFDEPTTGLHFDDINKLLQAFRALIAAGGSLIVIEHNLDVIKTADYLIDLGPEGGHAGGHIVATGTPEDIMAVKASHTGNFLRAHLANANFTPVIVSGCVMAGVMDKATNSNRL